MRPMSRAGPRPSTTHGRIDRDRPRARLALGLLALILVGAALSPPPTAAQPSAAPIEPSPVPAPATTQSGPAPAGPSTPTASEPASWWNGATLLGDLGGLRPRLADLGITPTLTWVSDIQGNPIGGERRAVREFENWAFEIVADLGKRAGLPGAVVDVSASIRSGSSLSDEAIGNVFNVAQVCCGATYRLVDLYYEQALADDRLNLRLGRQAAGDEFLASPLYGLFVSSAINGNPSGVALNAPGMTMYPMATWAARVRVRPTQASYVMAALMNGDASLAANDKHGADFSMRGPLFAIVEAGYRLNQGEGARGLPGNYKVGAWYDDHRFTRFSSLGPDTPAQTTRGSAGAYLLVDQMVYRDGDAGHMRSLTPFASLVLAPDADVNPLPTFANGGLVAQGLVPGRDDDRAVLAVVYGRFSNRLQAAQRRTGSAPQDYELALEGGYLVQVTPWLQVEPDLQYVVNPGGTGRTPDALVVGVQLSVTF
jgi:porin